MGHASGDNEGIPFVKSSSVREEQRTYETNQWMMPNPNVFHSNKIFVSSPFRNYTTQDTSQFFNDIKFPLGDKIHKYLLKNSVSFNLNAPEVPVYLFVGTGIKTP